MFTTLAEVGITDLKQFVAVFATLGAEKRRAHGSRFAGIWKAADDDRVFVLIDWDSRESFERFRADPEVPPTMISGGITAPPRFTALARVAEFPA